MKVEQVLHMVGDTSDTSYFANSRIQGKAFLQTRPMLENAMEEILSYMKLEYQKLVFVDLGCSSGLNTLSFVAQALDVIGKQYQRVERMPPETQFFLNDLCGNDFNTLFHFLEKLKEERRELLVPYYVAAVPGSFYGRLFPCASVNLFHSSYSLQWLSQIPEGLENVQGVPLNKRNINIANTSPPEVVKAYQKQYQRDFSAFLKYRHAELCIGGEMVLAFIGRKTVHPADGDINRLYALLADALNAMVLEGRTGQDKVDTFELPFYAPSMQEVKSVIITEDLFDLKQDRIFEYSLDPFVNSIDDKGDENHLPNGKNVARVIRAVTEPLLAHQFGNAILDELFLKFADNISHHFQREQVMHTIFAIVLKKKA